MKTNTLDLSLTIATPQQGRATWARLARWKTNRGGKLTMYHVWKVTWNRSQTFININFTNIYIWVNVEDS